MHDENSSRSPNARTIYSRTISIRGRGKCLKIRVPYVRITVSRNSISRENRIISGRSSLRRYVPKMSIIFRSTHRYILVKGRRRRRYRHFVVRFTTVRNYAIFDHQFIIRRVLSLKPYLFLKRSSFRSIRLFRREILTLYFFIYKRTYKTYATIS